MVVRRAPCSGWQKTGSLVLPLGSGCALEFLLGVPDVDDGDELGADVERAVAVLALRRLFDPRRRADLRHDLTVTYHACARYTSAQRSPSGSLWRGTVRVTRSQRTSMLGHAAASSRSKAVICWGVQTRMDARRAAVVTRWLGGSAVSARSWAKYPSARRQRRPCAAWCEHP